MAASIVEAVRVKARGYACTTGSKFGTRNGW